MPVHAAAGWTRGWVRGRLQVIEWTIRESYGSDELDAAVVLASLVVRQLAEIHYKTTVAVIQKAKKK